jgi:hypothetical protein
MQDALGVNLYFPEPSLPGSGRISEAATRKIVSGDQVARTMPEVIGHQRG